MSDSHSLHSHSHEVLFERSPRNSAGNSKRRTRPPPLPTVGQQPTVRLYKARSARWYNYFTRNPEPPSPLRYQVPNGTRVKSSKNVFRFEQGKGALARIMKSSKTWPQTPTGEQVVQAAASAGKLTLTVTVILCLVGVSYQLVSLTTDFLSYKIVSEVMITKNDFVRPPAMSICVPYAEAIDWSKTPEGYQDKKTKASDDFKRRMQEKYNISDLMNWVPNISNFLRYSWVRKQNSYGINESDASQDLVPDLTVTKFIKDYYICYRFMHINATSDDFYFRSHHITFGRRPGMIMGLYFHNKSFIPIQSAIIYLHPVDIYPRGDRDYPIILLGNTKDVFDDSSTYWGITYSETTLYLLPSPYGTNCIPYKKTTRWENEIHCQHDCCSREFVKKYGKSIFTATELSTDENNFTSYSKFSLANNPEEEKKVDEIIDKCNRSCPGLNCVRKYYIPQILVKRDIDDVVFELYDMNGPESISWAHEKMPPLTYLIGVISIIGVWMGISCIDILKNALTIPSRVTKIKSIYHPQTTSICNCPT